MKTSISSSMLLRHSYYCFRIQITAKAWFIYPIQDAEGQKWKICHADECGHQLAPSGHSIAAFRQSAANQILFHGIKRTAAVQGLPPFEFFTCVQRFDG